MLLASGIGEALAFALSGFPNCVAPLLELFAGEFAASQSQCDELLRAAVKQA